MKYSHQTNDELMRRVIMGGEGDALSRELALRLEATTEAIRELQASFPEEQ